MTNDKSRSELKNSTHKPLKRGESPRVAAALQALDSAVWTQSALAEKAGVNRGVLNQLWQGKTSSSPLLIGRLIAVLPKTEARNLLTAYLEDVLSAVASEQAEVSGNGKRGINVTLKVSFPPPVAPGAA